MMVTAEQLISDVMSLKGAALLKYGATPDYVVSRLMDLSQAKKTERIKIRGRLSKNVRFKPGTRKIAETDEEVLIERNYNDNSIQLMATSELKKILGLDAPARQELSGAGGKSFSEELAEVMKSIDGKSRGILPADQED